MDDAARVRAAARGVIDDIAPSLLHELLDGRLRNSEMAPGVLTWLSARTTSQKYDPEELDRHAAGVQLIYDGLDFTRTVSRSSPWGATVVSPIGEIWTVSRPACLSHVGSLSSLTEAASKAVETVRAFGRHEANRAVGRSNPDLGDRTLGADGFEMAIIAGTSAAGVAPPSKSAEFAADLARSFDCERPAGSELRSEPVVATLARPVVDGDYQPAAPPDVWMN